MRQRNDLFSYKFAPNLITFLKNAIIGLWNSNGLTCVLLLLLPLIIIIIIIVVVHVLLLNEFNLLAPEFYI
jgi:hypothetical protein